MPACENWGGFLTDDFDRVLASFDLKGGYVRPGRENDLPTMGENGSPASRSEGPDGPGIDTGVRETRSSHH
jgi:hypothetical protein